MASIGPDTPKEADGDKPVRNSEGEIVPPSAVPLSDLDTGSSELFFPSEFELAPSAQLDEMLERGISRSDTLLTDAELARGQDLVARFYELVSIPASCSPDRSTFFVDHQGNIGFTLTLQDRSTLDYVIPDLSRIRVNSDSEVPLFAGLEVSKAIVRLVVKEGGNFEQGPVRVDLQCQNYPVGMLEHFDIAMKYYRAASPGGPSGGPYSEVLGLLLADLQMRIHESSGGIAGLQALPVIHSFKRTGGDVAVGVNVPGIFKDTFEAFLYHLDHDPKNLGLIELRFRS